VKRMHGVEWWLHTSVLVAEGPSGRRLTFSHGWVDEGKGKSSMWFYCTSEGSHKSQDFFEASF
jgi:hypothetical protein